MSHEPLIGTYKSSGEFSNETAAFMLRQEGFLLDDCAAVVTALFRAKGDSA